MKKYVDGQYIEITQGELAEMKKQEEEFKKTAGYKNNRIEELKKALADTDYKILKLVEGELSFEECSGIIEERKSWRKEINELEELLGQGDE